MRALITVVDGSRLHDTNWVKQNLYEDQLKAAQIVVVSHTDVMTFEDDQALELLKDEYQPYHQEWIKTEHGQLALNKIDVAARLTERSIQPLLKFQKQMTETEVTKEIQQLPYHYVESAQGYIVAGWKLPKRWKFEFYALLDLLCAQQDWLRIKGIFNTDQGWKVFNFNPDQFNYKSGEEGIDNRIEIISEHHHDWLAFETALLACQLEE